MHRRIGRCLIRRADTGAALTRSDVARHFGVADEGSIAVFVRLELTVRDALIEGRARESKRLHRVWNAHAKRGNAEIVLVHRVHL